jgi:RimJ/RimL family protein N-acetyltransferase
MMHDPVLSIPVLETERLILRAPASRDFDTLAAFFADETRAWGFAASGTPRARPNPKSAGSPLPAPKAAASPMKPPRPPGATPMR